MNEKKYVTEGEGKSLFGGHNVFKHGLPAHKNMQGKYEDGLLCPHYKSQQQWIYSQYLKDCEKRGEKPMPRGVYFEF